MRCALTLLLVTGCVPAFDNPAGFIDRTRILGVRSEPAEARPGEAVEWEVRWASPGPGASNTPPTPPQWAWCTQPRTAAERTAVSAECLDGEGLERTSGRGPVLTDACARFGPNTPPTTGDEPPRRPADPDPSGGYYLPIRAFTPQDEVFGFVRIRCDLPGVTRAIFDEFEDRYRANQHPEISAFEAEPDPDELGAWTLRVRMTDKSTEPYVRYDQDLGEIVDETETLTAHWYTDAGRLGRGRSAVVDGVATVSWQPSAEQVEARLWVVVRDDRGGLDWTSTSVELP